MDAKPRRHSVRLKEHDYTAPGAYFITVETHRRICLFGDVREGAVVPSTFGMIAQHEWERLPDVFGFISVDDYVIMPNHVHGIIVIADARRGEVAGSHDGKRSKDDFPPASPLRPHGTAKGSLGVIVQYYKSSVTRNIRLVAHQPNLPIWQRNYYEHILRDERNRETHRGYILANPARWAEDEEFMDPRGVNVLIINIENSTQKRSAVRLLGRNNNHFVRSTSLKRSSLLWLNDCCS